MSKKSTRKTKKQKIQKQVYQIIVSGKKRIVEAESYAEAVEKLKNF